MDIVAHALWATAGVVVVHRRRPLSSATAVAMVSLAALPDMVHLAPIVAWWLFGSGTLAAVLGYAVAVPGQEPAVPHLVQLTSHHLHCVMHSAPIAALVTLGPWAARRAFGVPLLGRWSHIVKDVFTHSARLLRSARAVIHSRNAASTASHGPRLGSWC